MKSRPAILAIDDQPVNLKTLGAALDTQTVTLTTAQIPSHWHSMFLHDPGHTHGVAAPNTYYNSSNAGNLAGGSGAGTRAIVINTATTGITHNAICPGWVLTPLVQKQVDARAAKDGVDNEEAKRRLLGEKQPSLQFTTPEQLGDLAVFLCSAGADNVRGQAWAVDGGWTAQ